MNLFQIFDIIPRFFRAILQDELFQLLCNPVCKLAGNYRILHLDAYRQSVGLFIYGRLNVLVQELHDRFLLFCEPQCIQDRIAFSVVRILTRSQPSLYSINRFSGKGFDCAPPWSLVVGGDVIVQIGVDRRIFIRHRYRHVEQADAEIRRLNKLRKEVWMHGIRHRHRNGTDSCKACKRTQTAQITSCSNLRGDEDTGCIGLGGTESYYRTESRPDQRPDYKGTPIPQRFLDALQELYIPLQAIFVFSMRTIDHRYRQFN